jgi:glycosyltransferase involved in cell wall biosynthesis
MKQNTTFSIVTPSYNQGRYLAETIESVITQKGDFCIDYQVIDGGSTDESIHIIRHYEELIKNKHLIIKCRNVRFRWISEKDNGQADALKKGFYLAEGGILAWLNSDDVYLPATLQTVASFFQNDSEAALLYGCAYYCEEDGKVKGRYPTDDFNYDLLACRNFICQPSTFFRKKAYDEVGGVDDSLDFAMDYDLFIRIGKLYGGKYLPLCFSKYRLHAASKTMCGKDLHRYNREIQSISLKYFNWAPLNLVYGTCSSYWQFRFPGLLRQFRPLVFGLTLICTIIRSVWLNRGLRKADLKLLNFANFRKLFKERNEILCG